MVYRDGIEGTMHYLVSSSRRRSSYATAFYTGDTRIRYLPLYDFVKNRHIDDTES